MWRCDNPECGKLSTGFHSYCEYCVNAGWLQGTLVPVPKQRKLRRFVVRDGELLGEVKPLFRKQAT
jgi:hypothetical protein